MRLRGLPDDGEFGFYFDVGMILAEVQCKSGSPTQGLQTLEAKIRANEGMAFAQSPILAYWRAQAGQCALLTGRRDRARAFAARARAAFIAQPGVSPYYKAPLARLEHALGLNLRPV